MTVTPSIDAARLLEEQLAQASPDLLRELLTTFVNVAPACGPATRASATTRSRLG